MMKCLMLLAMAMLVAGCKGAQRIDRPTLDQLYQETQLAQDVLSVVPLRLEPDAPTPVVVNWWYAGTRDGLHRLVYRELAWDQDRNPVGSERRYRIDAKVLQVIEPFEPTDDASRWLPLYEAAGSEIEPPADLPTARQAPQPIENSPIQQPDLLSDSPFLPTE